MNLIKAIQVIEEVLIRNIFYHPKAESSRGKLWNAGYAISIDTQENIQRALNIVVLECKKKIGLKIAIDYNCTLMKMAEQIGIENWQAIEMGNYFKKRGNPNAQASEEMESGG